MENKINGNNDRLKEEKVDQPVKTIIVEPFKPLRPYTVPTSREEIKRQLGFKKR